MPKCDHCGAWERHYSFCDRKTTVMRDGLPVGASVILRSDLVPGLALPSRRTCCNTYPPALHSSVCLKRFEQPSAEEVAAVRAGSGMPGALPELLRWWRPDHMFRSRAWQLTLEGSGQAGTHQLFMITPSYRFQVNQFRLIDDSGKEEGATYVTRISVGSKEQQTHCPLRVGRHVIRLTTCAPGDSICFGVHFEVACKWYALLFGMARR